MNTAQVTFVNELMKAAPGCVVTVAAVSEADAANLPSNALPGAFGVAFTQSPMRLVVFQVIDRGVTLWVCQRYRTARTRRPTDVRFAEELPALVPTFGLMVRDDMRYREATQGALKLTPNDIVFGTWGYEQTNVNFYKVVSVSASGASAYVVRISQTRTDDSMAMGGTTLPNPLDEVGSPMLLRKYDPHTLRGGKSGPTLLRLWGGAPVPYTSYA